MTEAWTLERKLQHALSLPWTVRLSVEDGDHVARIVELRAVIGSGETEKALHADLYESMTAVLEAMLEHGDAIQPPPGTMLPWEAGLEYERSGIEYREIDLQADANVFEHIRATATSTVSCVSPFARSS